MASEAQKRARNKWCKNNRARMNKYANRARWKKLLELHGDNPKIQARYEKAILRGSV